MQSKSNKIAKQQEEMTKENIHPDLISKPSACTNVLVEKEIGVEALKSKGRNVYMVPFFNLLYYLGYFPIKFHLDKKKDQYFIQTHRVQQVSKQVFLKSFFSYSSVVITWNIV